MWRVPRNSRELKLVCVLCENVCIGPVFGVKTMHWHDHILFKCSRVLINGCCHQYTSQAQNLEQFVTTEEEHITFCEEDFQSQEKPRASNKNKGPKTHSQGTPCAYLTNVPHT